MGGDILRYALIGLAAWLMLPGVAGAEDDQAGVPLAPAEAAGTWTLQASGAAICTLSLKASKAAGGAYGLSPGTCAAALPAGAAGWIPTGEGMAITDREGKVLLAFDRWSNSLFVTSLSSSRDMELRRGGPAAD